MIRRKAATVAITVGALLSWLPSAHAQSLTLTDPAGDTSRSGLDITTVKVRNRDHAVIAKVSFVDAVRGDLIVSLTARHGPGVRIISKHRPQAGDSTFLLPGSFAKAGARLPCRGLTGAWDDDLETVKVRMPSRCLAEGNYGAIRFAVLTEPAKGGGDVDCAPERANGDISHSAWIPRG